MPPVKGALLSLGSIVSKASPVARLSAKMFASKKSAPFADVEKHSGGQTYGIPTHDALFKYALSDDSIRSSFFNAFVPNLKILSSARLDEHINPLMELQHLRNFINKQDTAKTFRKIRADPGSFVVCRPTDSKLNNVIKANMANNSLNLIEDPKTMTCLLEFAKHFEDLKSAFPKLKHNAKMDFVCETDKGEYALVEMQIQAQDNWEQRALAYVAAFYGNQLRKGGKWNEIRKVIGINILGGGKDDEVHWRDTPDQYERHYKMQEQIHKKTCERYIDGIELLQYSLMNAPDCLSSVERDKQDWITYFKRASRMNQNEVESRIQTPAVLKAFQMATLSRLPQKVKSVYDAENALYAQVSEDTAQRVASGKAEGKAEGLLFAARVMKQLKNLSDEDIASRLNLTVDDVAGIQLD